MLGNKTKTYVYVMEMLAGRKSKFSYVLSINFQKSQSMDYLFIIIIEISTGNRGVTCK